MRLRLQTVEGVRVRRDLSGAPVKLSETANSAAELSGGTDKLLVNWVGSFTRFRKFAFFGKPSGDRLLGWIFCSAEVWSKHQFSEMRSGRLVVIPTDPGVCRDVGRPRGCLESQGTQTLVLILTDPMRIKGVTSLF